MGDGEVDAVVRQGRVEGVFDHGGEAVYLVDKEHIVRLQAGEQAGEVARLVEHGTRGELEAHAEFVGNDVGEGGFAQSRRPVEQSVVERFATVFGRLDEDAQVVDHLLLTAEVVEGEGPEGVLEVAVGGGGLALLGAYVKSVVCHIYIRRGCWFLPCNVGEGGRVSPVFRFFLFKGIL